MFGVLGAGICIRGYVVVDRNYAKVSSIFIDYPKSSAFRQICRDVGPPMLVSARKFPNLRFSLEEEEADCIGHRRAFDVPRAGAAHRRHAVGLHVRARLLRAARGAQKDPQVTGRQSELSWRLSPRLTPPRTCF